MRKAFINTLTKLARKNKNIFLLTGDLGFSVFEKFREEFPDRFFDVGVAEQNMVGIAAGLALSGKTVFIYSIIPFATMRCFEQIRNDICMQNLNVKIVGMGAGLHYGSAGPTHHSIADICIMRSLPNMTVISPGTPKDTEHLIQLVSEHKGPVYIRLGKIYALIDHPNKIKYTIGKGILVKDGKDVTVISTGAILYNAMKTAEILENKKISTRIINIHTIKPFDKSIIFKAAQETKAIFTVEEHSIIGGLGTAVSEVLSESNFKILFKRIALPDAFVKDIGNREYLLRENNLLPEKIAKTILRAVRIKK